MRWQWLHHQRCPCSFSGEWLWCSPALVQQNHHHCYNPRHHDHWCSRIITSIATTSITCCLHRSPKASKAEMEFAANSTREPRNCQWGREWKGTGEVSRQLRGDLHDGIRGRVAAVVMSGDLRLRCEGLTDYTLQTGSSCLGCVANYLSSIFRACKGTGVPGENPCVLR